MSPAARSTEIKAIIELVFAGMLWGFGFVAAAWSLEAAGPLAITGWRFIIAGLIGSILFHRSLLHNFAQLTRLSILPGFLISLTLVLQTWGLMYTTVTKSAFLTCLYVLIVPAMQTIRGGRRPSRAFFFCGAIALLGVALMCGLLSFQTMANELSDKDRINRGDFLTLLCAFVASAHILSVDAVTKKVGARLDSFAFNTLQSLWAGVPALILSLPVFGFEAGAFMPASVLQHAGWKPVIGIMSLTLGSTLIAFALQVRAQKVIAPNLASLLFLLESPFAALFGFFLLGERLGAEQLIGGSLIILSITWATHRAKIHGYH